MCDKKVSCNPGPPQICYVSEVSLECLIPLNAEIVGMQHHIQLWILSLCKSRELPNLGPALAMETDSGKGQVAGDLYVLI